VEARLNTGKLGKTTMSPTGTAKVRKPSFSAVPAELGQPNHDSRRRIAGLFSGHPFGITEKQIIAAPTFSHTLDFHSGTFVVAPMDHRA
jgi:hypothetical protein